MDDAVSFLGLALLALWLPFISKFIHVVDRSTLSIHYMRLAKLDKTSHVSKKGPKRHLETQNAAVLLWRHRSLGSAQADVLRRFGTIRALIGRLSRLSTYEKPFGAYKDTLCERLLGGMLGGWFVATHQSNVYKCIDGIHVFFGKTPD